MDVLHRANILVNLWLRRLGLEIQFLSFHPNGITTEDIHPAENIPASPTLGYLARLSPLKGLDLLVDAFIQLKDANKYRRFNIEDCWRHDR